MPRGLRLFACAVLVGAGVPAQAETSAEGGWRFKVVPYFWAAGVQGSVTIRSLPSFEVDASFSDVMDNFDIGLLARTEGRKGRWGFATDLIYLDLGAPLAGNQPIILILEPPIDVRQFIGEGAAFYRVARDANDPERAFLDVLAGARYVHAHSGIGVVGGGSIGGSIDWVDVIGGVRGRAPLGSRAGIMARADVGGLGSSFAYNLEADLAFAVSRSVNLGVGYRYLHEDKESGSGNDRRSLDVGFSGPGLFVAFSF